MRYRGNGGDASPIYVDSRIDMTTPTSRISGVIPFALVVLLLLPSAAAGQVVRGTLTDGNAQRVPGVVVTLVDSSETVRSRALSDDQGEYSIRAPVPGRYRLRALRIGFRPVVSREFALAAGEVREEPFVLDGASVPLEVVRISEKSVCGPQRAGGASAVYEAWDQAMTSVTAASLSTGARGLTATTMQVDRTLDPSGRRVRA